MDLEYGDSPINLIIFTLEKKMYDCLVYKLELSDCKIPEHIHVIIITYFDEADG